MASRELWQCQGTVAGRLALALELMASEVQGVPVVSGRVTVEDRIGLMVDLNREALKLMRGHFQRVDDIWRGVQPRTERRVGVKRRRLIFEPGAGLVEVAIVEADEPTRK